MQPMMLILDTDIYGTMVVEYYKVSDELVKEYETAQNTDNDISYMHQFAAERAIESAKTFDVLHIDEKPEFTGEDEVFIYTDDFTGEWLYCDSTAVDRLYTVTWRELV